MRELCGDADHLANLIDRFLLALADARATDAQEPAFLRSFGHLRCDIEEKPAILGRVSGAICRNCSDGVPNHVKSGGGVLLSERCSHLEVRSTSNARLTSDVGDAVFLNAVIAAEAAACSFERPIAPDGDASITACATTIGASRTFAHCSAE